MPAKPKTSRSGIVSAALELIDEAGADALSMLAVAERTGVRGPSLYKHFPSRAALLGAVETQLFSELGANLAEASMKAPADEAAKRMASAYRAFAKRHPRAYGLMFVSALSAEEAAAASQAAAKPVLDLLYAEFGDADAALFAARSLTAFCHGFVSMELAGAFRLGGSIDAAFAEGVETILAGIKARYRKLG
jgi:AcrR family transcriptional regulator